MNILRFVKAWPEAISQKNRGFILQLIYANTENYHEREQWLNDLESTSEEDADELIKALLKKYA
jgi:hypothetical protein